MHSQEAKLNTGIFAQMLERFDNLWRQLICKSKIANAECISRKLEKHHVSAEKGQRAPLLVPIPTEAKVVVDRATTRAKITCTRLQSLQSYLDDSNKVQAP